VRLHETREVVKRGQDVAAEWRQAMGLERKPSTTRSPQTLPGPAGTPGVDCLGFQIRQSPVGKPTSGKDCRGRWHGVTTPSNPSKIAIPRPGDKRRKIVDSHQHAAQDARIGALHPGMIGGTHDDAHVVRAKVFQGRGNLLHRRLGAWAGSRHPNKKQHWLTSKDWRVDEGRGWIVPPSNGGPQRSRHEHTPIRRDVKGHASRRPYAGDGVSWSSRWGRHPHVSPRVARLLKRQQGTCRACERFFPDGDVMDVDHIIPQTRGGTAAIDNLQRRHRHCHAGKTAREIGAHGTDDNRQGAEEPDERKRSRPVVEPSRDGDVPAEAAAPACEGPPSTTLAHGNVGGYRQRSPGRPRG
jgi:RNA-directed DNA polymerase